MTRNTEQRLSAQTSRRHYATRIVAGAECLGERPAYMISLAALGLMTLAAYVLRDYLIRQTVPEVLWRMMYDLFGVLIPVNGIILLLVLLELLGTPRKAAAIADDLHRAGLKNDIDEPPLLLHRCSDNTNPKVEILEFQSVGIPRASWEDLQEEIEVSLNCYIVKIQESPHRNRILLHTVPSGSALPDKLHWSWDHAVQDGSTLVLGQTVAGTDVTVDLAQIPHILVGGSTGSGKSNLVRLLLMEAISKGMDCYIADFKGVDFAPIWHQKATIVLSVDPLVELLDELIGELEARKTLFRKSGCANIEEHNAKTGDKLRRILFACDEVAELLDKTGATKEQKEQIDNIISAFSTIARQSRAFGIHLLLATQRPDSQIVPGQVKNNIDCRICGRADQVLSQIILDSTDAADRIPKDSHKFLMGDGTMFQPYLFTEGALL